MARLARGDRVVDPEDRTKTAVIVGGPEPVAGMRFYHVLLASQEELLLPEEDLVRIEVDPHSPAAWLVARPLADPLTTARLFTHLKITAQLTDVIYSLSSTRTLFRVHQFKPVLKVIDAEVPRLLLADEVGLGKTIEAGLVWSELDARSPTRRVLVVCPSGLRTKWQRELERRFDREVKLLDRRDFLDFVELYNERGDSTRLFGIASYSQLRGDDVIEALSTHPPTFDLVIADEAHAMRNSETKTHHLGELLAENTQALLLLSATPVNLGSRDLFNLLRLLRPDEFTNELAFDAQLEPNRFVNAAASRLRSSFPPDCDSVADTLRKVEGTSQGEVFRKNPVYIEILDRLATTPQMTRSEAIELHREVVALNTLAHVYTRTRKRELKDQTAIRRARNYEVELTPPEKTLYAASLRLVSTIRAASGVGAPGLAAVMPARQASSCLPAMQEYVERLQREGQVTADLEEGEEDDESFDEVRATEAQLGADARVRLAEVKEAWQGLHSTDTKFAVLAQSLSDLRSEGTRQFLVFSFFRLTLAYLDRRITAEGYRCAQMHGGIPMRQRDALIASFRRGDIDVLLCSEIGSEGLDFEFCNTVINYDLPWNPMRLEQRIGRLDRFGQQNPIVHVVNFKIPETIDTEIFFRLYDRIRIFEQSIGELEPILGQQFRQVNRALAARDLTSAEQHALAEQVEAAIVQEQQELETFEEDRARLIGADSHIEERLDDAVRNRRYITPDELLRYVDSFLRLEVSPARIERGSDSRVVRALTGSPALADHLRAFSRGRESTNFSDLLTRLETGGPIAATFDAESAYEHRAEFITARHPLVRSITDFYAEPGHPLHPGGYVRIANSPRSGSWIFFLFLVTATGITPRRVLEVVACGRHDFVVDEEVGDEIVAFLAGPGPVAMEEQEIPIVQPEEARQAYEVVLTTMAHRQAHLRTQLIKRNEAVISSRAQSIRHGLEVNKARLLDMAGREGLNERIRRMRLAQVTNQERQASSKLEELDRTRTVTVGFRSVAAGLAEFVGGPKAT